MFLWSAQCPKKIDDCPKSLESNTQEAVASRFCAWPFPETEWCIWSFQCWQSDRSENGLNYNMVLSWQWLRNIFFFQGKKVQRREQLRQQASSSLIFTFWGLERLTIQFNRIPQNLLSFSKERFYGGSLQESCLLLGKSWNKIWNSSCLWWLVLKAIKNRRVFNQATINQDIHPWTCRWKELELVRNCSFFFLFSFVPFLFNETFAHLCSLLIKFH